MRKKTVSGKLTILSVLLLMAGASFVFWQVNVSQAGAISDFTVTVADSVYTLTFTPTGAIPAGGQIHVKFIDNRWESTVVPSSLTLLPGTTAGLADPFQIPGTDNEFSVDVDSEFAAGIPVTVKLALTNPPTGRYYAVLATKNDQMETIDGSLDWESTYRAYYTIGTPIAMGRVLDPDGNPLGEAWVDLSGMVNNQPVWGADDTDDQGYYAIGAMDNGAVLASGSQVRLKAHAPHAQFSLGSTDELLTTYDGTTINQNLQFITPTKTITGTIKYANGNPVANARVNLWNTTGSGWAQATTNSSGIYTVTVKGGKWDVMPEAQSSDNWSFGMPPTSVSFQKNSIEESQVVNFTVKLANSTVTGSVRLLDGSAPSNPEHFHVGVFSMNGPGANGQLDSSGNFSINVPEGTYDIDIMDWQQNYSVSKSAPFSIGDGETKNLGVITLIERNAIISGQVTDAAGNPLNAQLRLNAFMMRGSGWAGTQTGPDGTFSMKVFPGEWMVNLDMWWSGGEQNDAPTYVMSGKPRQVKISSGETKQVNVKVTQATATISGNIVNASGDAVGDMYGWVFADKAGSEPFMGPGMGGAVDRGRFSFKVPAGTYNVGMGPMPGSDYSAGDMTEVTISDNQTVTHNITVYANDMTITGEIRDENGNKVTGVFMEVFASNHMGGWQNAFINQSEGTYTLEVASAVDPWNLGYFVDPRSGYFSERLTDSQVSGSAGDTLTKHITVRRADATISGRVLDGDGNPLPNTFVFADNRSGDQDRKEAEFMGPMFMNDNMTDENGNFSIQVPNGTYYVGAAIPPGTRPDLINPPRIEVAVGADGTVAGVELAFRKADSVITGKVKLDGKVQDDAFIWGWSEEGGYAETVADENGNYTLNVTKDDVWHIGTNNDVVDSTDYVKSPEYKVDTEGKSSVEQNISLETVSDGLIEPVSEIFSSTNSKTSNLSDGTRISVPANALATNGNVTLNASTTSEMPRTVNAKPVGTGLELSASDSNGSSIISFNSNLTISVPYDEDDLADMKVTEDDLTAAYWDETSGIWKPVDSFSIDKENNKVSFSTNHFTTFALVSDAVTDSEDTATIDRPHDGEAEAKGPTEIKLTWDNPDDDNFDYVQIYRSKSETGNFKRVRNNLDAEKWTDDEVVPDTRYYYRVYAVSTNGMKSSSERMDAKTPPATGLTLPKSGGNDPLLGALHRLKGIILPLGFGL